MKNKILISWIMFFTTLTPSTSQAGPWINGRWQDQETFTCYVKGYAYSHQKKNVVFSNTTTYTYYIPKRAGEPHCPSSHIKHAKKEWINYLKSELGSRYLDHRYSAVIIQQCNCNNKDTSAKKYVKDTYYTKKFDFLFEHFHMKPLKGFSVSNTGHR